MRAAAATAAREIDEYCEEAEMGNEYVQPPEIFESKSFGYTQVVKSPPGTLVSIAGQAAFQGAVFGYDTPGKEAVLPIGPMQETLQRLEERLEIHGRFARWLLYDEPFPCTAERALRDMEILSAAERSVRERRAITLSDLP